jgi:hypothetical protein
LDLAFSFGTDSISNVDKGGWTMPKERQYGEKIKDNFCKLSTICDEGGCIVGTDTWPERLKGDSDEDENQGPVCRGRIGSVAGANRVRFQ